MRMKRHRNKTKVRAQILEDKRIKSQKEKKRQKSKENVGNWKKRCLKQGKKGKKRNKKKRKLKKGQKVKVKICNNEKEIEKKREKEEKVHQWRMQVSRRFFLLRFSLSGILLNEQE